MRVLFDGTAPVAYMMGLLTRILGKRTYTYSVSSLRPAGFGI